jgi:hypothetical protein
MALPRSISFRHHRANGRIFLYAFDPDRTAQPAAMTAITLDTRLVPGSDQVTAA